MPNALKESLLDEFTALYPMYQIHLAEVVLEQQKYNNCGPEVIENFILYMTGHRLPQEDAVIVHSMLFEEQLMLAGDNYLDL